MILLFVLGGSLTHRPIIGIGMHLGRARTASQAWWIGTTHTNHVPCSLDKWVGFAAPCMNVTKAACDADCILYITIQFIMCEGSLRDEDSFTPGWCHHLIDVIMVASHPCLKVDAFFCNRMNSDLSIWNLGLNGLFPCQHLFRMNVILMRHAMRWVVNVKVTYTAICWIRNYSASYFIHL